MAQGRCSVGMTASEQTNGEPAGTWLNVLLRACPPGHGPFSVREQAVANLGVHMTSVSPPHEPIRSVSSD